MLHIQIPLSIKISNSQQATDKHRFASDEKWLLSPFQSAHYDFVDLHNQKAFLRIFSNQSLFAVYRYSGIRTTG